MAFSPEHSYPPLEAPSSFGSDKGDEVSSVLQSNSEDGGIQSPLRTAHLDKAFDKVKFDFASKKTSSESESHVKVFLRIRPISDDESSCAEVGADGCSVRATAPYPINQKKEFKEARDYSFTKVLDEASSQTDVYESAASDIVNSFCEEGKSGLIFTYGVTNAGKSYTVLGNQSNPGLLPMSLEKVCSSLNVADEDILTVSYMEIYNEQIYDLLESNSSEQPTRSSSFNSGFASGGGSFSEKPRKNLKIRDHGGKVVVEGLSHHKISSAQEAMTLIDVGSKERQTSSHNLNADSSRSHSVCSIELIRKGGQMSETELNQAIPSILWLVDLAGSERGERTGSRGVSKKQTEANSINTSLFTLMACLGSLRESSGGGHGNGKRASSAMSSIGRYRESKLTRILAPHLSGHSKSGVGGTCMIVNANPRSDDYVETCYVLSQTAPCTKIKIKAQPQPQHKTLLAQAAKIDKNGRRIMKGAVSSMAAAVMNGGNGKAAAHKKRSLINDDGPNRRARIESNDSLGSSSTSTSYDQNTEENQTLKAENKILRKQLEESRIELENNEMIIREECAQEMTDMMNKYFNVDVNGMPLKGSTSSLSSVDENEVEQVEPVEPVNDYMKSARKQKKQEQLQKMVDNLQNNVDELEDELSRVTAETETLKTALSLSRKDSDVTQHSVINKKLDSENHSNVAERWKMLDFFTQLLIKPDSMETDVFQIEAEALKQGLKEVSSSSSMRECAEMIHENEENQIKTISYALRQALNLNVIENNQCDAKLEVEVSTAGGEQLMDQAMDHQEGSEVGMTVNPLLNPPPLDNIVSENEILDEVIEETNNDSATEVAEKVNETIVPLKVSTIPLKVIDPNSPHKKTNEKGKQEKQKIKTSGKYSPTFIGSMSDRIREKAVSKKVKKDSKGMPIASPRRTRSSTLTLRA